MSEAIASEGGAYEAQPTVLREAPPSSTSRWIISLQQTRWCLFCFTQRARYTNGDKFERHIKNRCAGLSASLTYAHARGVRAKTPPLASARSTTPEVRREKPQL